MFSPATETRLRSTGVTAAVNPSLAASRNRYSKRGTGLTWPVSEISPIAQVVRAIGVCLAALASAATIDRSHPGSLAMPPAMVDT